MVARHPYFRPDRNVATLEELWDKSEAGQGGSRTENITVIGYASAIGNSIAEVSNVVQLRDLPSAVVNMKMIGNDVGDTFPVNITGLDENKKLAENKFNVNGTTEVDIGNWFRIFIIENATDVDNPGAPALADVFVYESGSAGTKADPKTFVVLEPTLNGDADFRLDRSLGTAFTVPIGMTGYVNGFHSIAGRGDELIILIQFRAPGGVWQGLIPMQFFEDEYAWRQRWRRIPELFDIRVIAKRASGSTPIPVTFSYQMLLLENTGS